MYIPVIYIYHCTSVNYLYSNIQRRSISLKSFCTHLSPPILVNNAVDQGFQRPKCTRWLIGLLFFVWRDSIVSILIYKCISYFIYSQRILFILVSHEKYCCVQSDKYDIDTMHCFLLKLLKARTGFFAVAVNSAGKISFGCLLYNKFLTEIWCLSPVCFNRPNKV